jgi:hypothetical protein
MHKRVTFPLAVLAVVAAASGGVMTAGAATAGPGGGRTVEVIEKIVAFTEVDARPRGLSQGDSFVYRSDLLDAAGKKVGRGGGECVSIRPAAGGLGLTNCDSALELDGGQIAFTGLFDFTGERGSLPVIGGTGRYRAAGGQLDWALDGELYRLTVRLKG